jgi:hypothetical protein
MMLEIVGRSKEVSNARLALTPLSRMSMGWS